jgi:L-ribulose-5-phosphate 3-epimerase
MDVPAFRLGYATSGFAHHRLEDACALAARLGYRALSLTLDVHHLDPFAADAAAKVAALSKTLRSLDLAVVVETGARFLLDPSKKHEPTLLSREGAERRVAYLEAAIAIARDLGADCVSLWSGAKPADMDAGEARARLRDGLTPLLFRADSAGVDLAFEPEPGMFVETVDDFARLDRELGTPRRFGLAFDVGHALATEEGDPAEIVRRHAGRLVTAAIEDMRRGVHDHLMFGDGHLDLPAVVDAFEDVGYARVLSIELPRHAHDAARVAARCASLFTALGVDVRPR